MEQRARHVDNQNPSPSAFPGVMPSLAVLLVNWERPDLTNAALESLLHSSVRPGRVVVVDNASGDDSVDRIRQWGMRHGVSTRVIHAEDGASHNEWLTIIVAPANDGFSAGNNIGMRHLLARPEVSHVFLLNNDARVHPTAIVGLRDALRQHPDAGIVTGTIYVDGPGGDVWYAGGTEIPFRGLTRHLTRLPIDSHVRETTFVSGCAMLLSREAIERIGPLPECYDPGYWEDAEYSRRIRMAGFPVLYAPDVQVYHRVGATIGPSQRSASVTYVQSRNRLLYIRRNYTGVERAVAIAYNVLTKPGRALLETLKGKPRIGWAVLRGTVHGMFARSGRG